MPEDKWYLHKDRLQQQLIEILGFQLGFIRIQGCRLPCDEHYAYFPFPNRSTSSESQTQTMKHPGKWILLETEGKRGGISPIGTAFSVGTTMETSEAEFIRRDPQVHAPYAIRESLQATRSKTLQISADLDRCAYAAQYQPADLSCATSRLRREAPCSRWQPLVRNRPKALIMSADGVPDSQSERVACRATSKDGAPRYAERGISPLV